MKTFKEKVQSMTGKEIVMAMVNGLQKEWVNVKMDTFGKKEDGICYGCAATNAICEIMDKNFICDLNPYSILDNESRTKSVDSDWRFVYNFEDALDCLRRGDVDGYNNEVINYGLDLPLLPEPVLALPALEDSNYKKNLERYIDYANTL